jgi:hypothetical protein
MVLIAVLATVLVRTPFGLASDLAIPIMGINRLRLDLTELLAIIPTALATTDTVAEAKIINVSTALSVCHVGAMREQDKNHSQEH